MDPINFDKVADFLFEVGMLKSTPRTGYRFLGSGDASVAEHSFRTAIIGYSLARMTPQINGLLSDAAPQRFINRFPRALRPPPGEGDAHDESHGGDSGDGDPDPGAVPPLELAVRHGDQVCSLFSELLSRRTVAQRPGDLHPRLRAPSAA